MFNGTGSGFTGGSQVYGGVDDLNNSNNPPLDRYSAIWTQCTVDNSYCGTNDSGADAKDNNTGLVWSKSMNSSTYVLDDSDGGLTWFTANNCSESSGSACTKKTSSKTGCEANSGWFMPHQKQLLQAYIDGAYGNIISIGSNPSNWSAITLAQNPPYSFRVSLVSGYTPVEAKTTNWVNVRCVRPAP